MELTYKGQPVNDLLPAAQTKKVLGPDDEVIIINRGRHTLRERYDGRVSVIPPRQFCRIKYGSAMKFKASAVVPGTRNPLQTGPSQKQVSFIGICDVDKEADCEPFDDAFVKKYSLVSEAIDRSLVDPADADVETVRTNAVAASLPGAGAGGSHRPQISGDMHALAPVAAEDNAALREMAQGETEKSAMEVAAQRTRNRKKAQHTEDED
jgi:hypothetical protein